MPSVPNQGVALVDKVLVVVLPAELHPSVHVEVLQSHQNGFLSISTARRKLNLADSGRASSSGEEGDRLATSNASIAVIAFFRETTRIVAQLSQLNRSEFVHRALDEYRSVGRTAFLDQYGFAESRDYFVRHDGNLYDSKPLVAAAFGFAHPDLGPLKSADFSGGIDGAVRTLRRLGFEVVTRAQLQPPALGDEFPSRTAIQEAYGGQHIQGINRFPGDGVVNAFSDEEGPYADEPPSVSTEFSYRGEGLEGHQKLASPGNALLEQARLSSSAVRYWYRPEGGSFRFWCWVAVLGRAWVLGNDTKGVERQEIEWWFTSVPSPEPSSWGQEIRVRQREAVVPNDAETEPAALASASYVDLCNRVGPALPAVRRERPGGRDFQRSTTARRAVVLRSAGRCESPFCTGMPSQLSRSGEPILEVDHIKDLALGGDDHPGNMIALCPNCHAVKTRGKEATRLRKALAKTALALHEQFLRLSS
ncbi:HNH endonuclease signature motif containing protein [Leifsonia sp. SIMBA_070]|uniref:HNH endonuclease signature motif containing protein n=1 Tax=Leifsonia sp. SIMBA_070 TaxID=3085810 RepID=UPI00397E53F2